MTKKFHIVFLLVMLGFFLIPAITYACEMKSGESCCDKETTSINEKKDCCKIDNHIKKNKDDESCGGKSKHSSCSCPIFNFTTVLPFETEMKNKFVHFFSEKVNFYNKETQISSGFYSIWLIPKIS